MHSKKKILVAPLNWGLGHATRCIPVIEALENHGFEPILASDGAALALLKKEFPRLTSVELPSYMNEYSQNGSLFKLKLLLQMPNIFRAVRRETAMVAQLVKEQGIAGIISDNRLGVYSKEIPSVFITHQLNVLTGNTTWLATMINRNYVKKHNECWIPDAPNSPNLSGRLGHIEEDESLPLKYIGPLSRLHKKALEKKYSLMVLLSGAEPQRAFLEELLKEKLATYDGKVIFIRGVVEDEEVMTESGNITFYNFMNTPSLEQALNESEMVLCRSGYTTIMDLAKLCKKAFFIPTPGQYEQEYLAKKLKRSGLVPYAKQDAFRIEDLQKADLYKGLKNMGNDIKWKDLFEVFEGK